ncbi:MAG: 50S ribosomal protein L19e [Candidatus Diapherotrites archaeon]|nr:50S ribosomal protein L19e [Candidatus Diapherotrites archaeon]
MNLKRIRETAAKLMNTGSKNIWVDPVHALAARKAMTREDIKTLIAEKKIRKRRENAQSRGRARVLAAKKKKGRKSGMGKRSGTQKTRMQKKTHWMKTVRAQRKFLRELKKQNKKFSEPYRHIYNKIKGGFFKGKKYIEAMVAQEGAK